MMLRAGLQVDMNGGGLRSRVKKYSKIGSVACRKNMFADLLSQLTHPSVCASLSLCALAYCAAEWFWFRTRYDWHKIPCTPSWPILGDLPAFIRFGKGESKVHEYNYHMWKKLGRPKVFKRQLLGRRILVINDPAFVQNEVTGQHGLNKSRLYEGFVKILSPVEATNILFRRAQDEKWRAVRRNVAQAFSTESLKKTFPKVLSTAHQLLGELAKVPAGEGIDIQKMMSFFTFEVISSWGMGVETEVIQKRSNPLLDSVVRCGEEVMREVLYPWRKIVKRWLPFTPVARNACKELETMHAEIDDLYSKIDHDASGTEGEYTIASGLLRAKDSLSEAELKSEAIAFFLAGTDTTAQQLAWALCFLAGHEDVQSKMAQEVRDAGFFGASGKDLTYNALSSLPYTNAVIKESMRFQPVTANGSSRVLEEDSTVLGYRVPKNTIVATPQFTLNRLDTVYENPDAFDPDRWLGNDLPCNQHDPQTGIRKLWIFGNGPRDCVGKRLAAMEMQVMLPLLVGAFKIHLDQRMGGWEGTMGKKYDKFVTRIKGGLWVNLSRRD